MKSRAFSISKEMIKMCTGVRFTASNGVMYCGRNLDWNVDFGESIIASPRNWTNPRFDKIGQPSKYASIGVGLCIDDFPLYFDAGNEKGLSCAGLNFPGYAKYEDRPIEGKINVPAYSFPIFVVSQYATVAEAYKGLENVAIVGEGFNEQFGVSLLHWLISDKTGAIVVEYMPDGMHIYDNNLDVLANQPTFPWHHENVRNYISATPEFPAPVKWAEDTLAAYGSGSGMRGIPGDFYSPSRFVRAAYLNTNYPQQTGEEANILRVFKTLQGVAMVQGGAKMDDGTFEYTTFTSAFASDTMTYYYNSYADLTIRRFPMPKNAYEGSSVVKVPEASA